MSRIWTILMLASSVIALLSGNSASAAHGILTSGDDAVKLLLTLLATMTLWSGLMEILQAAGDVERLGRMLRKVAAPLFPGLKDDQCWSAMSMNLSANLLGLGNAATPAGVEAAKLLARQGEAGMKALAMLLVLDNASLQLMPATVITMRQAAGSQAPTAIWVSTLIVSGSAMAASIILMILIRWGGKRIGRLFGHGSTGDHGIHPVPGNHQQV